MKHNKPMQGALVILASVMIVYPAQQFVSAKSQPTSNNTTVDPTEGAYYKKGCNNCHGNVGQGSRSGKRLAEPVLPEPVFKAIVRRPYGIMPAYSSKILSDDELDEIYQYLQSLSSPKSDDIKLLQRENR